MAYSGVYVFGDSLVDSGNALKLAKWYGDLTFSDLPDGAPSSDQGYFLGRFSNGYNFADLVSNASIGLVTKPVFPYGFEDPWLGIPVSPFASDPSGHNLNFAYGGSQIRQGDEAVPDLDGQTDAFRGAVDGDADSNALYLITMGGNDVRSLAPSGNTPASQDAGHAALDAAADKLYTELSQLVDLGANNFLITGIPDVGLIPRYDTNGNLVLDGAELVRSAAATSFSVYLDTAIRTEVVPALQALGATVTYVPLMDYVDSSGHHVTGALSANLPMIAALHGLTVTELSQNLLAHQDLLFFDQIHPNAQANALLAAYMNAQLTGTPWVETLPLTGSDVDYRVTASIAAVGEVDRTVVSLVAGTTYTFEMLGVSSLGTPGSLADPSLRLLGPGAAVVGSNADSGPGFDATLTFNAATSGAYTIELFGNGSPTGAYAFQAAVVSGAAMQSGNTYVVDNALTVVLEGSGGAGIDVVKASLSYALSAGSEIEVLRTANDKGKTAINLTGNEFDQTIVGNSASNILEGKAGADVLIGGAGKDVFVLSNAAVTQPGAANIDSISDYGAGDVVDIRQILNVAAGTDVRVGGYLRVTTSGHIQVDLNGGGDNWVTLSNINGNGTVTVRYLSGGVTTNVAVGRTAEQLRTTSTSGTDAVLIGAIAGAGLQAIPAAAHGTDDTHLSAWIGRQAANLEANPGEGPRHSNFVMELRDAGPDATVAHSAATTASHAARLPLLEMAEAAPAPAAAAEELLAATPAYGVPAAESVVAAADAALAPEPNDGVAQVLADVIEGGEGGNRIAALIDSLAGHAAGEGPAVATALAAPDSAPVQGFGWAHAAFAAEALALHHDAPLAA